MKPILLTVLLGALASATAFAQQKSSDHAGHQAATQAASPAEMVDGEVRKIDKPAGKLTLKHGDIKSLDMPSMTMVFQVKDGGLLDKVKVGDKIKFSVVNESGKLTVTDIRPAP